MTNGEQVTGTRDRDYDLVSVLYHALQAGTTYQQYIDDAEREGDNDVAEFFREAQQQDRQRAQRAKELLDKRFH